MKEPNKNRFFVYFVRCSDNSLYCGYTTNLEKRVAKHNSGKGAKYTSSRLPVSLVYYEEFDSKEAAMSREWHIHHDSIYTKQKKGRNDKIVWVKKGEKMQREIKRKFFGNMNKIGNEETGKMSFKYVGIGDFFLSADILYMKVSDSKAFLMSDTEHEEIEFDSDFLVTPTIVDFYCSTS